MSDTESAAQNDAAHNSSAAGSLVERNLEHMDDLDFSGWNHADWHGRFSEFHTDDVYVDFHGAPPTHGLRQHIEAMEAFVEGTGSPTPPQITSHPIKFGDGEWTCVVGEFADGSRMVTVARWRDGKISEEYIWT